MTLTLTKKEATWGWFFLFAHFLAVPFAAAVLCMLLGVTSEAVINELCFFLSTALAVMIFRPLLTQSLRNCAGRWRQTLRTALKGYLLYWLVNIAVTWIVLTIEPEFGNVNDENISSMLGESPLLMAIAVIFAAPLAEECLFRGWMFTGLAKKSLPLAYAVTCGFFSAAHIVGYLGIYPPRTLLLCFIQYLGPSYVLCRTCQTDDSLCAPLLLHMVINAMGCLYLE